MLILTALIHTGRFKLIPKEEIMTIYEECDCDMEATIDELIYLVALTEAKIKEAKMKEKQAKKEKKKKEKKLKKEKVDKPKASEGDEEEKVVINYIESLDAEGLFTALTSKRFGRRSF